MKLTTKMNNIAQSSARKIIDRAIAHDRKYPSNKSTAEIKAMTPFQTVKKIAKNVVRTPMKLANRALDNFVSKLDEKEQYKIDKQQEMLNKLRNR